MNIPNLISLLRNGLKANKPKISVKANKKVCKFLDVLVQNKYILSYSLKTTGKVEIFLDFTYKKNKILSLKHISKPSKNVYFSSKDLWIFDRSLGLIILNTSHGIMSHKTALSKNLGGQALCYIF